MNDPFALAILRDLMTPRDGDDFDGGAIVDRAIAYEAAPGDVGGRRLDDTPANRPARLGKKVTR